MTRAIPFFFQCYADHRDLHSFPTRRSSDLWRIAVREPPDPIVCAPCTLPKPLRRPLIAARLGKLSRYFRSRSEEHTSELQSHVNLVCRLLLEKKKKKKKKIRQKKHRKREVH